VQAPVDLLGLSAQIGCSSATAPLLIATSNAPMRIGDAPFTIPVCAHPIQPSRADGRSIEYAHGFFMGVGPESYAIRSTRESSTAG
jgi:hypothetical protein